MISDDRIWVAGSRANYTAYRLIASSSARCGQTKRRFLMLCPPITMLWEDRSAIFSSLLYVIMSQSGNCDAGISQILAAEESVVK